MKEEEILNIALNIIVNEGIEKLSMRKIAEHVGCSPSTLYHHFTDKNDLLNKLVLYVYERIDNEYWRTDLDLREMIGLLFSTEPQYLLYQNFLRISRTANFITADTREVIHERIENHKKIWGKFRSEEIIREDVDKKTMHLLFVGLSQMIAHDNTITDKTRKNLTEVIYRGISGHNIDFNGESHCTVHRRMRRARQSKKNLVKKKKLKNRI